MALRVVIRSGETASCPAVTFDAPRIVIGRGEGCDVRLPDPSVSHRHASLRQRGPDYIIVDEGSTNGTFVGRVRLPPQAPRVVRSGELVRVGRIWLELKLEQEMATQQPQLATREIALALVANALTAEGAAAAIQVRVTSGPDAGKVLELVKFDEPVVIGRGPGVALPLDDDDASRRHVEVVRRGDRLLVRDLGSKNGSTLAGEALGTDKAVPWRRGTMLGIGANLLQYDDPIADALAELERVADERLGDDESIEPPPGEADAPPTAGVGLEPHGAAPVATRPRSGPRPRRVRRGWQATDTLVALLALVVLGLSLLGMYWLFSVQ